MWDMILPIALPMIVSCYVGMAETAVKLAVANAKNKPHLAQVVGEMQNELAVAQMSVDDMVRISDNYGFEPGRRNNQCDIDSKIDRGTCGQSEHRVGNDNCWGAGLLPVTPAGADRPRHACDSVSSIA